MSTVTTRHQRRLCQLEAALYAAGRPLYYQDIMPIVKTKSERVVGKLIQFLKTKYEDRECALEIVNLEDRRVTLQLKEHYDSFVKNFNHRPLLKTGPLKTLSYIAFHQPVYQRQVINDRGNHVYAHLKILEDMGLITRERSKDRNYIVKTTSFFGDYFGFSHNPAKTKLQLKQMFKELKLSSIENGNDLEDDGSSIEGTKILRELLADSRDRLPEGLSKYSSSTNTSS
jgi:segregation and condensation protein B